MGNACAYYEGRISLNLLLIFEIDIKFGFRPSSFCVVNIITMSYPLQHERMLLCYLWLVFFYVGHAFMKINNDCVSNDNEYYIMHKIYYIQSIYLYMILGGLSFSFWSISHIVDLQRKRLK